MGANPGIFQRGPNEEFWGGGQKSPNPMDSRCEAPVEDLGDKKLKQKLLTVQMLTFLCIKIQDLIGERGELMAGTLGTVSLEETDPSLMRM